MICKFNFKFVWNPARRCAYFLWKQPLIFTFAENRLCPISTTTDLQIHSISNANMSIFHHNRFWNLPFFNTQPKCFYTRWVEAVQPKFFLLKIGLSRFNPIFFERVKIVFKFSQSIPTIFIFNLFFFFFFFFFFPLSDSAGSTRIFWP